MNENANLRKLTVGYGWTNRKWKRQEQQPKITIQGAWLERAGFLIGEVVKVIVVFGIILWFLPAFHLN